MTSELNLGRLKLVKPRDVWPDEARDFTPWLLKNADVLSDLLGMQLQLEAAEHPVGGFSLDLIGRDEATDLRVIVENQLEQSNHTHLGQILTYAAGTNPTTIVWVATSFRPEHRAALDWLNERTSEDTRFFGVEIEVVQINDSAPAPAFRLVVQPNDWGKIVRAASQTTGMTEREQFYRAFWAKFIEQVRLRHPDWTKANTSKSSWISMSAGVSYVNWVFNFAADGLGVQLEFVHVDPVINRVRIDGLTPYRAEMEAAFGSPFRWDRIDGVKGTKIVFRGELANVADESRWDEWIEWLIQTGERFREALELVGGVPIT
jgi:hypothetical protein